MIRRGRGTRASGREACAYEAGQATSPSGNVGLVAIRVSRALALEVGVKSWETGPVERLDCYLVAVYQCTTDFRKAGSCSTSHSSAALILICEPGSAAGSISERAK